MSIVLFGNFLATFGNFLATVFKRWLSLWQHICRKYEREKVFAIPEECMKGSEEEQKYNKHEWENKKTYIIRDGKWVNQEMKDTIDNIILTILKPCMSVPENYFITINEYHEKTMKKLTDNNRIPNVFDHPDFADRIEDKIDMDAYFTEIAVFGLKPIFLEKSDKEILSDYGGLFFVPIPCKNDTFVLSKKYGAMFDDIYNNPIVERKRTLVYKKIVEKLLSKDRLFIEKVIDAALLFPSEIVLSSFNNVVKMFKRHEERHVLHKCGHINVDCPSLDLDYQKIFQCVSDVIHDQVLEKLASLTKIKKGREF